MVIHKSLVTLAVLGLCVLCASATDVREFLAIQAHKEADGVYVNEFEARYSDWSIHHYDGHDQDTHFHLNDKGDRERFRAMVKAFERMQKRFADAGIK